MNLAMKKKTLLMSLFLSFTGIVAGYAQQTTYKGLPTGDTWVRSDKPANAFGNQAQMQMQLYAEGITSYGVMSFEFTAPEDGQEVKSAVLRTMTRVFNGGDRTLKVYALPAYVDAADNATWNSLGDNLTTALASEPIASITIAGQLGKNISNAGLNASMQTVAAWQNTIDLTEYVKTLNTNKFSILIAKVTDEEKNSQFYQKEAPAMNWDASINEGAAISEEDVRPLFTVTYKATGSATAIQAIEARPAVNDNVYYNLQGVRVAQPTKGLYIVNGKKIFVK